MAAPEVQQNRKLADPSMKDLLDLFKKQIFLDMNCHHIGKVSKFYPATQTIDASINYKKVFNIRQADGTYTYELKDYPPLVDVPVVILGGGSFNLSFPITAGDDCVLLFNDRAIDNWYASGQVVGVPSTRLHSFSDAIALVGLKAAVNAIASYDETRAKLFNGQTMVGVSDSKVKIANAATTLNTLLQSLTTQLQALTTQLSALTVTGVTPGGGVSGVPSNAAAIATIGTNIGTLATQIGGLLE